MKCKWSLISFGPKYLLKMARYTVKNVIKDLDIMLKSSSKYRKCPFRDSKFKCDVSSL